MWGRNVSQVCIQKPQGPGSATDVNLQVKYCLYVYDSERGVLYTALVYCADENLQVCMTALKNKSQASAWAHEEDGTMPMFVDGGTKKLLRKNAFLESPSEHGPFPPLKLLQHTSKSFYSNSKGGLD